MVQPLHEIEIALFLLAVCLWLSIDDVLLVGTANSSEEIDKNRLLKHPIVLVQKYPYFLKLDAQNKTERFLVERVSKGYSHQWKLNANARIVSLKQGSQFFEQRFRVFLLTNCLSLQLTDFTGNPQALE